MWSAILFAVSAHAAEPSREQADFFETKIRPVLAEHCYKCHSEAAKKTKGNLTVDSLAGILKGGDTGPAIVPGHPEKSLLLKALTHQDADLKMPPKNKLADSQIADVRQWIKDGALWPGSKNPAPARGKITDEDRRWWAFQPVQGPKLPAVNDNGWCRQPLDRFILARLQAENLSPAPPAERVALVRRLYFDLHGLPPTPAEMDEVQSDQSPDWYEMLVDRLLASPRYGERWARHWLDLVRYAESDGYRIDEYRPEAWRYRDYVIKSFNDDKPYDRFVQEQLAGDEIDPDNPEAQAATGFLRLWIYEYNQRDVRNQWSIILDDITDVTADVFLGLGMGCARCHDHKFDPILQKDYYRLQAFFAPMLPRDDLPLASPQQRAEYASRLAAWETKTATIRKQIDKLESPYRTSARNGAIDKFPEEIQAIIRKPLAERTPLEHQLAELAFRQVIHEYVRIESKMKDEDKQRLLGLRRQLAQFDAERPTPLPAGMTVRDVGPVSPPTFIPKKSNQPAVEPGFLTLLEEKPAVIEPVPGLPNTTGRRSTLARWLTRPDHPLTSRVIVNRIWQYHFGRGLAAHSSDFGKLGEKPSHPELLDGLASRFVSDGWSMKRLHRMILTSATYRQSARHSELDLARRKDPDNRLLWHMPTRRLDAEQIRDAVLNVTGELNLTMGGPSVDVAQLRRTIYSKLYRNTRDPLLDVFDVPEGLSSTPERNVTTTPTQALLMFNSSILQQRAKALAARLQREETDDGARIDAAFRLLYGRPASPPERSAGLAFLQAQANRKSPAQPVVAAGFLSEKMPYREGRAAVMNPNSAQARFHIIESAALPTGDFTIEAFVMLRSIQDDAQVRTIASHWAGDRKQPGWSFGVTGKKSAFKPETLVLQFWGDKQANGTEYEAIFSGLRITLNTPYFVAVTVKLGDANRKGVTFYAKDLSNDDEPMLSAACGHQTIRLPRPGARFTIGGHDGKLLATWDGLIDDVRLSDVALRPEQLLLTSDGVTDHTVGYWQFEKTPGVYRDSSPRGNHIEVKPAAVSGSLDARAAAFVDLCHVLLNSNEFMYVD